MFIIFLAKYDEARERRANNWATLNPLLYETYLDGLIPTRDCIVCSAESKIMCPDCTYGSMFCEKCFEQTHRNLPFHIPLVWQVSILKRVCNLSVIVIQSCKNNNRLMRVIHASFTEELDTHATSMLL